MVDRHAGRHRSRRDRGNPVAAELKLAMRNWRLPVERLSRLIDEHQFDLYNDPMPTMARWKGYINDTSSALFSLGAGHCGTAVRRGRASRASRRTSAGHDAVLGGIAAGRLAAAVVRAAAIAPEPRQLDGRSVRGQVDAKVAGGAGSVDRRSAGTSETAFALLENAPAEVRPVFLRWY